MTSAPIQLSVVLPCLNEASSLPVCLEKAHRATVRAGINTEIIVADNGSTDGSLDLAARAGVRVVNASPRGYGAALIAGITASNGRYVLMADADNSYDLGMAPAFVEQLEQGFELVQGCRLPTGGGIILPGAMRWLNRCVGNPLSTWMVRKLFHANTMDANSGMRAFTRVFYNRLNMKEIGMTFATEMIIKSAILGAHVTSIPLVYEPDSRPDHRSHFRNVRDSWSIFWFIVLHPHTFP
jgi:glycosyltransferase involved in cell wall biosynthesis